MCELFGYSGSRPLDISPYLRTLASHSPDHPHGWGIASFSGNAVNLEKEPKCAWLSDYLRSRLDCPMEVTGAIAHIRQATVGGMAYPNCHPFCRRDASNRPWTLAHNGTIFESAVLEPYRTLQTGNTDSERILCHLVRMSSSLPTYASVPAFSGLRFEMVDSVILDIAEHNKLNLLLYDGDYLYVHTNMAGTLYSRPVENGILFATVPLDRAEWEPVPMNQLLVYDRGRLIYTGTKHSFEYRKAADPDEFHKWAGL